MNDGLRRVRWRDQAAAKNAESASHALTEAPARVWETLAQFPDAISALAQGAAREASWAAQVLIGAPDYVWDAPALHPSVVHALAQAAAPHRYWASQVLTNAPDYVWDALATHPDVIRALAQAAQQDRCADRALQSAMAATDAGSSDARAHAIRKAGALIAAAADLISIDVLTAWVRAAPPEALAQTDVIAAVLAQESRAADASLIALLEARVSSSSAPPPMPVGARRRRG
jgi:hypothetical protein